MFFYIYKTTNLINGKYYYGRHTAKSLTNAKLAIKKYGKVNFSKEIIEIHESYEKCVCAEERIVDDNTVNDPASYNLIKGGEGAGPGPYGGNNTGNSNRGKKDSDITRQNKSNAKKGKKFSKKHCENKSIAATKAWAKISNLLYENIPERKCEWCSSIIDIRSKRLDAARRSRFCNKSCSTRFGNKRRGEINSVKK